MQTATAQQVNLLVGSSVEPPIKPPVRNYTFWDEAVSGNGTVEGGVGTWSATAGNWTIAMAPPTVLMTGQGC